MASNAKHIVFIHGRGYKPEEAPLHVLWRRALHAGVARDFPDNAAALNATPSSMIYYGDLTNRLLDASTQRPYDSVLDLADRQRCLEALEGFDKAKNFRRANYEKVPGKSSVKEFLADVGAPITSSLGLGQRVIGKLVPEIGAYWNNTDGYALALNQRCTDVLVKALNDSDQVLVVAHCLGSMVAYNALWEVSAASDQKIHTWLTLGSPLSDDTVKRNLADRNATTPYPTNIMRWHNLAAEDDYMCHDETMANDYAKMVSQRVIMEIVDHRIYNLAVRYGKSNPHCATGYLIHPRTSELIKDWLVN